VEPGVSGADQRRRPGARDTGAPGAPGAGRGWQGDARDLARDEPRAPVRRPDHAAGVVLAQVSVDVKTNEIPLFSTLLDQIPDLEGTLITADAVHAQVAHLKYLHKRSSHLLVCVKGNQPTLRKTLKGQPWTDIPVGHTESGRGHGRIEKRTLKVATVEAGLGFPHATQAIQIVRRSRPFTPGTG
jgi:hypothetical protein